MLDSAERTGESMKAATAATEQMLRQRKLIGADRWDEMWEGVLHMAPSPNKRHTRLQGQLLHWLHVHWARPSGGQVDQEINVAAPGRWPHDYRIPDLSLLMPDRFSIDRDEYYDGAPTVAVEIRSPGDETWDKFPFYARIGVAELWVIDRDSKAPQVFRLIEGSYEEIPADPDGWHRSPLTGVWLRAEQPGRLGVQMAADAGTFERLPED
jgi:Uma2 family endonuclease